ncbi:glycosyltransferase [Cryobacterium sp. TMT1-66-1]|uniref:glycosyltransferase n=1 Tax=Cryobacterium sp. TMT1-66-1 TaxID=1259242 RepID=UPI00106C930F|nr:glycosyltransferase [Cryobacterium sp. TMT1-66-1]TFD05119.1 glycosyltransferase [Cryobacterium sp. TMT1-66-1]
MTVAALVVSHNRVELLRRCLSAILVQSPAPDEVILVDNVSTDGSVDMVRNEFPMVTVIESLANLGGAGGFALGIDIAIQRGHSAVWMMDDDAEPTADSLRPLVDIMTFDPSRPPGFVASTVVDANMKLLGHNPPEIVDGFLALPNDANAYQAPYASFVGVLVNLDSAKQTFLPMTDFFIWYDDLEYTSRLSEIAGGVVCRTSLVMHPNTPPRQDSGSRLIPLVRNRLWTIRDPLLASVWAKKRALRQLLKRIVLEGCYSRNKFQYIGYLRLALWQGLFSLPSKPVIGEMVAAWEHRISAQSLEI